MIEKIQLPIYRYRDDDEHPTCAISFPKKQYCLFLISRKFGTEELCWHTDSILERRKNGLGTLIPHERCPLWEDLNEKT